MKILNFFLCLIYSVVLFGQNLLPLSKLCIDSLVSNKEYAERYMLNLDDKHKFDLVDSLLRLDEKNGAVSSWNHIPQELDKSPELCSGHSRFIATTYQAVALYLVEVLIRNDFFLKKFSITPNCIETKQKFDLALENVYFISVYEDNMFVISLENKSTLFTLEQIHSRKSKKYEKLYKRHIKNLFRLYSKWFNKIKRYKKHSLSFAEACVMHKDPLSNTKYAWTLSDFEKRQPIKQNKR